ncbi:MAG: porin [Pseudomonadota bacterium]
MPIICPPHPALALVLLAPLTLLGAEVRAQTGGRDPVAAFTLEAGGQYDRGGRDDKRPPGRQWYVGRDSRLGAQSLDRHYRLTYLNFTEVADPFKGGMSANLAHYSGERYDHTVKYVSPRLRGLSASAMYSYGEAPYSNWYRRAYGGTLGYANGLLTLSVAHQRKRNVAEATGSAPAADLSARSSLVAANMRVGAATAYAAYGRSQGDSGLPWDSANPYGALALSTPSTDSRDVLMGLSIPYGATTLMASFIRKDDHHLANRDASQIALGMTYSMSRRTDLYAAYAKIKNRHGAAYSVGQPGEPGRGDSAVNVGVRHAF